jgi:RNA polymerase sigma-70 factor (ECF subfamily)
MTDLFGSELAQAMRKGYVAAYRWLRHRDEALDACQEAARRALRHRERFDPSRPFYPWFYGILRNHCFDRLRKRGREVPIEAQPVALAQGADERLATSEQFESLRRAMDRLDEPLREIIELRHLQDASYEEMAAILDIPMGTVMSRLYRARIKLRQLLMSAPRSGTGAKGDERRGH